MIGVDDFEEEVELEDIELMDVSLVLEDLVAPASLVGGADDLAPPEHALLVSEEVALFPYHSRGTGSTREVVFAVGGKEIGIERDGGATATTTGLATVYTAAVAPLHAIATLSKLATLSESETTRVRGKRFVTKLPAIKVELNTRLFLALFCSESTAMS
ncbi:hypothetical protein IW261DRAFT_1422916 [Armillaria novae-zelandiae]|uniref:Uncharacterized protein n=1 Tax=Armillaria novae-zelandiae TaxID=153914 RepID=A0AA39U005_9AGAR|nr:hypothetical protein IW261DRAFT_1422916 [Armillaria novae-zelandiae]